MSASLHQPYDMDLAPARHLLAIGQKQEAYAAYLDVLRRNPKNNSALHELGRLAFADSFLAAACKIFQQLVDYWPQDLVGRLNLGNALYEDGNLAAAREQFEFILKTNADSFDALRGLGRVLYEQGEHEAADQCWRRSFPGQAIEAQPYDGPGSGTSLLVLGSARRGNIQTQHIIDDRIFAAATLYTEYYKPELPLPAHSLVFNAIGDADLCPVALAIAEEIVTRTHAPVINHPSRVSLTGRATNATRLGTLSGLRTARTMTFSRNDFRPSNDPIFPLLLRATGFHNGEHFVRVKNGADLERAMVELPGETLLAIEYLNARGTDGMARKYRVMCIGGVLYPLHLAISASWKVHYLTADMATSPANRAEEERFLVDMPAVLGAVAMKALAAIGEVLALDYVGFDFALGADGSILLFEANATMVINPPPADRIWDYRRASVEQALDAARRLLVAKAMQGDSGWKESLRDGAN